MAQSTDEEKQIAFTHLAQGKRHLMVKDYFEAVSSFASACEYLAKIFGDNANECGDAYFNYGKALLELARSENGVLGNAMEDEPQSGDDEEDESDEEDAGKEESEVKPDQNENANTLQSDASSTTESKDIDDKVEVGGGDAGSVNSTNIPREDNEAESTVNGQNGNLEASAENEDNDEGEVSNLNLAWEVLELAKSIFTRQAESDHNIELKLAEVHLLLGEVGLESENFTQGTDDMLICLELQKKNLEPDNRRIAETYYQLGMGYGMANRFDDAIEAYTNCRKVLEDRVVNLRGMIEKGLKPEGDDPFYTFEGEIKDIEEIFPEIKEKILDMTDFKNETKKAMLNATMNKGQDSGAGSSKQSTFPDSSTAFGSSSSVSTTSSIVCTTEAKPVSNINHLVRKKPRLEVDSATSGPVNIKRVCVEDAEQ